ncbi:hypothetical protein [Kosakonia sp.]|uniref:hypothetical protein n=1 Tax=Kosakonia sp. TaxID=1916651 RepID=UPI002899A798|nr:hypothetical protein [Kosakonia sp.]
MSVWTEYPLVIGIALSVLALVPMWLTLKGDKKTLTRIRDWKLRDSWQGETITTPAETWQRTETKFGDDYFYDFFFSASLNNIHQQWCARGIVEPDQIHKLKKGITITVKYSTDRPPRLAVTHIHFS